MGARRQAREFALQALYALDVNPEHSAVFMVRFWESHPAPHAVRVFAEEIVHGVTARKDELDRLIERKSRNWSVSRMARVDLNILRMAAFELMHRADVPKNVTLNEAVEIAKTFGADDSAAFVNGILDELAKEIPDKAE